MEMHFVGGAQWQHVAPMLSDAARRGDRGAGVSITSNRTSWVQRLHCDAGTFYLKTYEYATWSSRIGQLLRRPGSVLAGRAAREFAALQWLASHGFAAPEAIAHGACRVGGLVHRGLLISGEWPGERVDHLVHSGSDPALAGLAEAVGRFVAQLHRAGFRDRNLDARNLLARPATPTSPLPTATSAVAWTVAKLDSPRFVLRRPGPADDALAAADWQRLLSPLPAAFAAQVRAAAARGS